MKRLLDGLKVLDFTWAIAGPFVTKFLADHGAIVIKVENAERLDMIRTFQPFKDGKFGINRGGVWAAMNSGKRSLGLDMRRPEGVDIARRLAAWCDVLVENFAPGTVAKWGMSYDELKEINDDIIMVSTSSMGQTGPFAHYHGLGFHLQGFAGFNQVTGFPDREPFGSIPYTDFVGGPFALAALMGALDRRRRTGQGQFIDLSQVEASLHLLSTVLLDSSVNGREAQRDGNRSRSSAPHGAYRCLGDDRWCVIAVTTDAQWRAFRGVLGDPPWTQAPELQTLLGRLDRVEELDRRVEEWTLRHAPHDVMERMQAAGVPAGVVEDGKDLAEDPQHEARHFYQHFDHPEIGSALTRRSPVLYSDADSSVTGGAPTLGQDTEYVLTQVLGMSDDEWIALLEAGVVGS